MRLAALLLILVINLSSAFRLPISSSAIKHATQHVVVHATCNQAATAAQQELPESSTARCSAAKGIGSQRFTVKPLTAAEVEVLSLARHWHPSALQQLLVPVSGAACLVAYDHQGAVAGWVDVLRRGSLVGRQVNGLKFEPIPAHGYLCNLFVIHSYRRQGIAKQLMAKAEQLTQKWGLNHMCLTVNADNAAAVVCYMNYGYVVRGALVSEAMLWKDLTPLRS
jgi:ribosomal protein S18 acetylase RimI-like enzyme